MTAWRSQDRCVCDRVCLSMRCESHSSSSLHPSIPPYLPPTALWPREAGGQKYTVGHVLQRKAIPRGQVAMANETGNGCCACSCIHNQHRRKNPRSGLCVNCGKKALYLCFCLTHPLGYLSPSLSCPSSLSYLMNTYCYVHLLVLDRQSVLAGIHYGFPSQMKTLKNVSTEGRSQLLMSRLHVYLKFSIWNVRFLSASYDHSIIACVNTRHRKMRLTEIVGNLNKKKNNLAGLECKSFFFFFSMLMCMLVRQLYQLQERESKKCCL